MLGGGQKRVLDRYLGTGVMGDFETPCGGWKSNLNLLQEQQMLLFLSVALTLQPFFFFFKAESCTVGKISQWVRAFFSTKLRT